MQIKPLNLPQDYHSNFKQNDVIKVPKEQQKSEQTIPSVLSIRKNSSNKTQRSNCKFNRQGFKFYYFSKPLDYNYFPHMSKILTIALLCFSLFFIAILITLSSFLKDYKEYNSYKPMHDNWNDGQILETSQFEKLKQLASYPLVGQFYLERLAKQLVMRKQWEMVMTASEKGLTSLANRRSYRLWHSRAVAQCAQFKIQDCRKSLYQAEILAPASYHDQLQALLAIFNYRHKSRLQAMRIQVETI